MSTMNLKGELHIGRVTGGDSGDVIRIEITDKDSRARFVTAELTLEQFAQAVTGLHVSECRLKTRALDKVGTRFETKEELVPCDTSKLWDKKGAALEAAYAAVLKPFDVDGWRGDTSDLMNHHCRVDVKGKQHQRVRFFRNVPCPIQSGDVLETKPGILRVNGKLFIVTNPGVISHVEEGVLVMELPEPDKVNGGNKVVYIRANQIEGHYA